MSADISMQLARQQLMQPVMLDNFQDPVPCDGHTTNFTKYVFQSFSNGKCEGDGNYNSKFDLGVCYTSVLGTDSFDCYDEQFGLLNFYDYKSTDGTCKGNYGYFAQKDNNQCYSDYLQLNSLRWTAE